MSCSVERPLSSSALIRAYQEDVDRKRLLIRKAETTRNRLVFVTEALRKLLVDENFVTLLRAEGLRPIRWLAGMGRLLHAPRQADDA